MAATKSSSSTTTTMMSTRHFLTLIFMFGTTFVIVGLIRSNHLIDNINETMRNFDTNYYNYNDLLPPSRSRRRRRDRHNDDHNDDNHDYDDQQEQRRQQHQQQQRQQSNIHHSTTTNFGQQIVQQAFDSSYKELVSICTPEMIRTLANETSGWHYNPYITTAKSKASSRSSSSFTARIHDKLLQQQQQQQKQPSKVQVSPKMKGLRHCLQYVIGLATKSGKQQQAQQQEQSTNVFAASNTDATTTTTTTMGNSIRSWPWWLRTLMRDMEMPRNGLYGVWHQLQFHPTHSFVDNDNHDHGVDRSLEICVYEKGGTKQFRTAHCRNVNNNTIPKDARQRSNCYLHQRSFVQYDNDNDNVDDSDNNMIMNDKIRRNNNKKKNNKKKYVATDRVVFLRDPLDRFLSGFLDKCVRRGDTVDHCEPSTVFYNTSTSPVHNMLWDKRFFFDMYVDTLGLKFNMHFFPQAFQCGGLYNNIQNYNFVGNMGTNFYRDLTHLTELYPEVKHEFDTTFKLSSRGSQDNDGGVETGAATQVLDYYTPRTVRRVLQYYAIDYVMLNLPIPDWAENMLRQEEEGYVERDRFGQNRYQEEDG